MMLSVLVPAENAIGLKAPNITASKQVRFVVCFSRLHRHFNLLLWCLCYAIACFDARLKASFVYVHPSSEPRPLKFRLTMQVNLRKTKLQEWSQRAKREKCEESERCSGNSGCSDDRREVEREHLAAEVVGLRLAGFALEVERLWCYCRKNSKHVYLYFLNVIYFWVLNFFLNVLLIESNLNINWNVVLTKQKQSKLIYIQSTAKRTKIE